MEKAMAPLRLNAVTRLARRAALGVLFLLPIAALGIALIAASLDHPAVKQRLLRLVEDQTGLVLDYEHARVALGSGLRIEGLRVRSPALADHAPYLLRIDAIEASWSLRALLGLLPGPRLQAVAIDGAAITLVSHADGRTSVDPLLGEKQAPAPGAGRPLSRTLAETDLPFEHVRARRLAFTLIRTGGAGKAQRIEVGGADISLRPRGKGSAQIVLDLGTLWHDLGRDLPQGVPLLRAELEVRPETAARRTSISLTRLEGLSGSLHGSLDLDVPDDPAGPLLLRRAEGRFDAGRVRGLLSAFGAPAKIGGGRLDFALTDLEIAPQPRLLPSGKLSAQGSLHDLVLEDREYRLTIDKLDLEARSALLSTERQEIGATLSFRGLSGRAGATALALDKGSVVAEVGGPAPYRLRLRAPLGRAELRSGPRALVRRTPLRIDLVCDDMRPDARDARRSTGAARLDLALGPVRAFASLRKQADRLDLDVDVGAPQLGLIAALLPAGRGPRVPWDRMGLTLRTRGALSGLMSATPRLSQRSEFTLARPSLRTGALAARAERVSGVLESSGTQAVHRAELSARLVALALAGRPPADGELRSTLVLDRTRPRIELSLDGRGEAGPAGRLRLMLEVEKRQRALRYDVEGDLRRLGLLAALLPRSFTSEHRIEWPRLAIAVKAKGEVGGLVRGVREGGAPVLEVPALERLSGGHSIDLALDGLRYEGPMGRVEVDRLVLRGSATLEERLRKGEAELELPRLVMKRDDQEITVLGARPHLLFALHGPLTRPEGEAALDVKLAGLKESYVGLYPVGRAALSARLCANSHGAVQLSELRFRNEEGGTELSLHGGLDLTASGLLREAPGTGARSHVCVDSAMLIPGRSSVSLRGTLSQDLGALRRLPHRMSGRGRVKLSFETESANLSLFHTQGVLEIDAASLEAGARRVRIERARGSLPIRLTLLRERGLRFTLVADAQPNLYPRLRFSDHHPFMGGSHYLSLGHGQIGEISFGPLAGNLRIENNLIAMDQLEMRLGEAKVTGQLLLDYQGAESQMSFRGAVIGLLPRGTRDPAERLDATAVLTYDIMRHALDGRAELARIGRRHLYSLLDLLDPGGTEVGMNRIRLALRLGYPRRARVLVDQGFARLGVDIGGLASGVRIDEVRGLAAGPLIRKYLEPILRENLDFLFTRSR